MRLIGAALRRLFERLKVTNHGNDPAVDIAGTRRTSNGGSTMGPLPPGVETPEPAAPDIAAEAQAIMNAPVVTPGPPLGRCSWCGRLSHDLTLTEVVHGLERFKCHVCTGTFHE
jgi:hypothetical protein